MRASAITSASSSSTGSARARSLRISSATSEGTSSPYNVVGHAAEHRSWGSYRVSLGNASTSFADLHHRDEQEDGDRSDGDDRHRLAERRLQVLERDDVEEREIDEQSGDQDGDSGGEAQDSSEHRCQPPALRLFPGHGCRSRNVTRRSVWRLDEKESTVHSQQPENHSAGELPEHG